MGGFLGTGGSTSPLRLQSQIFFVGIDSECFETDFKTKISKSKIFYRYKIFSWDCVIFDQNSEKMEKSKIFVQFFFVKIDSECLETYFRTKISKSMLGSEDDCG